MPFIPVPGVCLIELIFNLNAQICENTLYRYHIDGWNSAQRTTLAGEMVTWWNANLKARMHPDGSLTKVKVTDISSSTGGVTEYTTGLPILGTLTGTRYPNNVAACVRFATSFRGRWNRGRNYLMGLTDNAATGNNIISTWSSAVITAYNLLKGNGTITRGEWVVVSRFFENAPRLEGVTALVSDVTIDPYTDSQRRRLIGRGQ